MTPSKQRVEKVKYYFCEGDPQRAGIPLFFITPKEFFDEKGFLLDAGAFNPIDHLPEGFQRVADSTFEFIGNSNPIELLLKAGHFKWRDMIREISYNYMRKRLIE